MKKLKEEEKNLSQKDGGKDMKWNIFSIIFLLTVSLSLNCKKEVADEEAAIRDVLLSSIYTKEDFDKAGDEGETIPKFLMIQNLKTQIMQETLPWVKFRRKLDSLDRIIKIRRPAYPDYPETTALAIITSYAYGHFFVKNVPNISVIHKRAILDSGYRRVFLEKGRDGWKITKLSPLIVTTKNAPNWLKISQIVCHARPSNNRFALSEFDTLLRKSELPIFLPNDTVKVTVRVEYELDSGWVFLHRGPKENRKREPFYKLDSYTFEREWIIGSEELPTTPLVRASIIDFISFKTLFGDSLDKYNAQGVFLPYIIKKPAEEIPEK